MKRRTLATVREPTMLSVERSAMEDEKAVDDDKPCAGDGCSTSAADDDQTEGCPICLEPLEGASVAQLPCGHKFRVACLSTLRERLHQTCPLCRAPLPPPARELFDNACRLYFPLKARLEESGQTWDCLSLNDQRVMDEVLRLWHLAADQGLAVAQCNLGFALRKGRGTSQCFDTAVSWYRKAAAQRNANAECNLGLAYYLGRGAPKDHVEAARWYRKSADQGYPTAQFNLGLMCAQGSGLERNDAEAAIWYERAAIAGHADAQCNLGNAFYIGAGPPRNDLLATKWYRKAAAQGHADAQCNLGLMNERGEGMQRSLALAVEWYTAAASQGHRDAAFNLGAIYERGGDGIEQSDAQAVLYFRIAAELGCPQAQHNMGVMSFEGRVPVDRSVADGRKAAAEWYALAAAQGHVDAKVNLALMLEEGDEAGSCEKGARGQGIYGATVARDLPRALSLYEQAATLGDQPAAIEAERLRRELLK